MTATGIALILILLTLICGVIGAKKRVKHLRYVAVGLGVLVCIYVVALLLLVRQM